MSRPRVRTSLVSVPSSRIATLLGLIALIAGIALGREFLSWVPDLLISIEEQRQVGHLALALMASAVSGTLLSGVGAMLLITLGVLLLKRRWGTHGYGK